MNKNKELPLCIL